MSKKEQEATQEILLGNYDKFKSLVDRLPENSGKENAFKELESDLTTFITTPASTRRDLVCAYAGGLLEHSLRVLSIMSKMRAVYDPEAKITTQSIITVALFHDIGKAGNGSKIYYLDNDSEWHKEKQGLYYVINPVMSHIPVSQLSLQFLTRNGFSLNSDEWYAISSIRNKDGKSKEESFSPNEPMLAMMLQHAVSLACAIGKNRTTVSPIF